jgi:predicted SnoaL-like aldol condensation-catalyzing enzyme
MGVSENKALVRRFYEEVWDRGHVEFAHEVFADDYIRHDLRPTEALPGGFGMAKIAADFRRAFPDARWRVDLVFGEGDFVAARWTATGTFLDEWGAVSPTGAVGFGTIATTSASWSRSAPRCSLGLTPDEG